MITLYGLSSPNVMKVMIALEEMRLPYELIHFDIFTGTQFEEDFLRLSPNGKVPVIVDHDVDATPVFESCAILLYLAEKSGLFAPPAERSAILQWLFVQAASIGPSFGQATHFLTAAQGDNDYALNRHLTEVRRLCKVVDRRLGDSFYLASPDYSIADMAAFPWMRMYADYGIDLDVFPNLRRWLDAVGERDIVRSVVAKWPRLKEETLANRAAASPDQLDRVYGRGRHGIG